MLFQSMIIKSPRYTGGDFMFLYRFVRRRRPQILVHAITFEQLFGFLSFLARLSALEFSRSNMEFAISQPKVVRLPRNEKQTYRLNSRPQMWPTGLTLTITLTFEFCRSNMTLTFDYTHDLDHGWSWSNFEIAVSQNGRADWHFTKGVAVGHSWPWPFGDQGQVYGSTR